MLFVYRISRAEAQNDDDNTYIGILPLSNKLYTLTILSRGSTREILSLTNAITLKGLPPFSTKIL